jgi:hypothetical protein
MNDAYLETTILTNILLKPGSKKQAEAKSALAQYKETLLPVYSIKEWKKGPLDHYAYVHDKLVQTKSLADTLAAISSLSPSYASYKKSTSLESLEAATRLQSAQPRTSIPSKEVDRELADRYRLALASLIVRTWQKRRSVATRTIQDLDCYTEARPRLGRDGYFDLKPQKCDPDHECCLADALRARPDLLKKLRDAIPESSSREEDRNRRKVLKQLINTPKLSLTEEQCRRLGDAIFAFFCPPNAIILTTNMRDHQPLAEAVGKIAQKP